ncbi:MAG: hypothetical protein J6T10_06115 [Methanobrevibacter sp.]|nr:hypothetical protein [Methanobrevibacter sp.]
MIDYEKKKPIEFIVKYVPYKGYHGEKWICVPASYRTEAYFKAIYEEIPKVENGETVEKYWKVV